MEPIPPRFYLDYVDPLAYLVESELAAAGIPHILPSLQRVPLELRPPPDPLLDPDALEWRERWELAEGEARRLGIRLAEPPLLPWTRKAHELVLHATAKGVGDAAHRAVFDAVFLEGRDVGRVDVLVELAGGLGLDATETRATLDVDRYAADVAAGRVAAARSGVAASPALVSGHGTLQGFHNRDALRTFLLR
ncbi:MAG: DsbA family oxidoreductase [Longimicrobiales bacterium]